MSAPLLACCGGLASPGHPAEDDHFDGCHERPAPVAESAATASPRAVAASRTTRADVALLGMAEWLIADVGRIVARLHLADQDSQTTFRLLCETAEGLTTFRLLCETAEGLAADLGAAAPARPPWPTGHLALALSPISDALGATLFDAECAEAAGEVAR